MNGRVEISRLFAVDGIRGLFFVFFDFNLAVFAFVLFDALLAIVFDLGIKRPVFTICNGLELFVKRRVYPELQSYPIGYCRTHKLTSLSFVVAICH